MAHGRWLSDEERQQILTMRKEGVPVTAISAQIGRSTNFIYRILRNANTVDTITPQAKITTTKKQKTMGSATTNIAVQSNTQQSQMIGAIADSNTSLLCAVDNMEVSCEPIPFTQSTSDEQRSSQAPVCPSVLNATVGFTAAPPLASNKVVNSAAQTAEEFWFPSLTTTSNTRPAVASMAQRTSTNSAATVSLQPQRQVQPSTKSRVQTQRRDIQVTSIPAPFSALVVPNQLPMQRSPSLENATVNVQESTLDGLFKRIQDEIHRLGVSQSDIYDAQFLQVLVKFQAEMRLVQLQRTHSDTSQRVRTEEVDTAGKDIGRLLREKLAMEVALLNVQADREKLELHREQIKHQLTSILCRRKLQDVDISPTDLDWLLPRQ